MIYLLGLIVFWLVVAPACVIVSLYLLVKVTRAVKLVLADIRECSRAIVSGCRGVTLEGLASSSRRCMIVVVVGSASIVSLAYLVEALR